jgi:hypothetical protein
VTCVFEGEAVTKTAKGFCLEEVLGCGSVFDGVLHDEAAETGFGGDNERCDTPNDFDGVEKICCFDGVPNIC